MKLRSPVILGLAFDERGVSCAEVFAKDARREQRRLGRFTFEPGATLAEPAACGAALRKFLDAHDFDTKRAILGVPAKWVIASERELPPTGDAEATLGILRMQAERMAVGGGELVTDVAGDVPKNATRALIVGILRQQLDRLTAVAAAAELDVAAVTVTSLAAHAVAAGAGTTVLLGDGLTELVSGDADAPRVLRHVSTANPTTDAGLGQLGGELRRTMTLSGQLPVGQVGGVRVWDALGLDARQRDALASRAGVTIAGDAPIDATLADGALNGAAKDRGVASFAAATALAIAGTGRRALPLDFLDSRLAPPPVRRFGRKAVWAVVLSVAAVLALVLYYTNVTADEARAAELAATLKREKPDYDAAQATLARIRLGRSYFEGRPPILDGMREVTLAFNYDEPIWASSFAFRDDKGVYKGAVQGRTTNPQLFYELRDRLQQMPHLTDVSAPDLSAATGRGGEQTFLINFTFKGNE